VTANPRRLLLVAARSCGLMQAEPTVVAGGITMLFEEALNLASREEAFKATIYAMNTLLIDKGVYTREEFEALFIEWVGKERRRLQRTESATESIPCSA